METLGALLAADYQLIRAARQRMRTSGHHRADIN